MTALIAGSSETAQEPRPSAGGARPQLRIAYLVSRFPRLTETFVAEEAHAVRRAGASVELHPLHRERAAIVQPASEALAPHVHYHRLVSPAVLASQVRTLRHQPRAYLGTAAALVRHNWGSRRLLVGALAAFPLAVHLARTFEQRGIDHVHAHFATHPAAVAYVVHRLTGISYSFTAHGSDLHRDRHMLAEKVRTAAFVATVSTSNRQVIIDECGTGCADRVEVVRCGVNRERFVARPTTQRAAGSGLRICCVGTLHEVKGQRHLIEACRLLRSSGSKVEVTFVGGGPDRTMLEHQAESAGVVSAITFTGPLTAAGVEDVLRSSDLLVAPSVPTPDGRREGLPVVLLEAMATGVPVVASNLSGIPEAVRHEQTGLLVEPGDAEALATAIHRIDGDAGLADALASAAQRLVSDEFDLDASARRLVELFDGDGRR